MMINYVCNGYSFKSFHKVNCGFSTQARSQEGISISAGYAYGYLSISLSIFFGDVEASVLLMRGISEGLLYYFG